MRKGYAIAGVALAIVLLLISVSLLSKMMNEVQTVVPLDEPTMPPRGYFMGVLPTPHQGQTFKQAYAQAAEHAELVPIWGRPSPFYSMKTDLSGDWGDLFIGEYTRANGMFPLVHFSFFAAGMTLAKPPGMDSATLSDQAWRDAYKKAVLDTVREVKPLYLSVGNEVNRWYERYGAAEDDPNSFLHFVTLYEEVYDAVKQLSNRTEVFCVFAREIVSEYREADLEVLQMFDPDRMDLLVFTSYAYAAQGINSPDQVPDDYYSRALSFMPGKRLGFSELGWPSIAAFGDEEGQAEFLSDVAGRLTLGQGVDLHMLAWCWLHDLDAEDETGLIEHDGTPKLAYEAWAALSEGA